MGLSRARRVSTIRPINAYVAAFATRLFLSNFVHMCVIQIDLRTDGSVPRSRFLQVDHELHPSEDAGDASSFVDLVRSQVLRILAIPKNVSVQFGLEDFYFVGHEQRVRRYVRDQVKNSTVFQNTDKTGPGIRKRQTTARPRTSYHPNKLIRKMPKGTLWASRNYRPRR
jgi:hypothetical protein